MNMLELVIYLTVFFGAAVLLLVLLNREVAAEDRRYTAGIPPLLETPVESPDETAPPRAA